MQRLHEDDLVGHVLEQENWEHIRLPAIAEEEETHLIESALLQNTRTVRRHVGEALHPEREPLATLKHLRRTIGEYNFAGQYQQQPAPLSGGLVTLIQRIWVKTVYVTIMDGKAGRHLFCGYLHSLSRCAVRVGRPRSI